MVALAAHNLSISLSGRRVLKNVSISANPGEVLIIVGPNGAGKSTLLRALSGEVSANEGSVTINGFKIDDLSAAELAHHRSLMPQHASLTFPFKVRDVVAMGREPFRSEADHEADRTAIRWGMTATDVSGLSERPYTRLSGGEQQRVQLARVLAQSWRAAGSTTPHYVLLDEPTASLDLAHQHATLHLAQELAETGAGVIAVVHDLNLAALYADRVAVLSKGELAALGSPEEVLMPPLIEDIFGLRVKRIFDEDSCRHLVLPTGHRHAEIMISHSAAAQ
ncbi:heme ABC transporter ATP-binding protein [Pyruvatibacter sp.]|uniref:heme ABC transporter ATP-binding protein n=1 Tax=Pyruvatibacter sp. TaxID=1981328 RepID=UPI0032EFAE57